MIALIIMLFMFFGGTFTSLYCDAYGYEWGTILGLIVLAMSPAPILFVER